ncbi:MAG: hypothetical protein AB1489_28235 [Acidobacteriota bacterium]
MSDQIKPVEITVRTHDVRVPSGVVMLDGILSIPSNPVGIVLFAHGFGSSRHSAHSRFIARFFNDADISTLLFDLLMDFEVSDPKTNHLRFDLVLLAERLVDATKWIEK